MSTPPGHIAWVDLTVAEGEEIISSHPFVINSGIYSAMRTDALEGALDSHGNVICVVASAGTTNTGAIDPLPEIAAICQRHDTWLHVDAAYGGGGLMSTQLRPRYRGIEMADSVVMDMHKWFFQALDGSLLLYRNPDYARQLFVDNADYLRMHEDDSPGLLDGAAQRLLVERHQAAQIDHLRFDTLRSEDLGRLEMVAVGQVHTAE